jgi:hypothetical protein
MENIFKFKKAKKMVGEFDADDPHEWTLLTKPQIGDVTLFVHFHKLWLVTEVPEVEEDEENGIEYQAGVQRMPVCEVYYGFLKDDKFVVERQNQFKERIDELAQKRFLQNLQRYLDEGYSKDYNNYKGDDPIVPNYYGHQDKGGINKSILQGAKMPHKILKMNPQTIMKQAVAAMSSQPQSLPPQQNP